MSFRVLVHMSVVNEDGEEVNFNGHIGIVGKPFKPLEVTHEIAEFESVSVAHRTMNTLLNISQSIGELPLIGK